MMINTVSRWEETYIAQAPAVFSSINAKLFFTLHTQIERYIISLNYNPEKCFSTIETAMHYVVTYCDYKMIYIDQPSDFHYQQKFIA